METFKPDMTIQCFEPVSCPVCRNDDFHELFHVSQRTIVECNHCRHEYVNPAPIFTSKDIYFFSPSEENTLNTKIDLAYITRILKKYHLTNRKLLDLGCGQGRLTQGLIQAGWDPKNLYLVDRSKAALDEAKKKYKSVNTLEKDIYKGIGLSDYFDCIIMVEFLEDLIYPAKALAKVMDALRPGGILIIRGIPNNKSFESFIAGENWKMRGFEKHYSFFNSNTFVVFANQFPNMEILELGTFLQEGFCFFNLPRIGKNIGVIKKTAGDGQFEKPNGETIDNEELTRSVLKKLKSSSPDNYWYKEKLPGPPLENFSSREDIESFFDRINLDYLLSSDFSVVARKL